MSQTIYECNHCGRGLWVDETERGLCLQCDNKHLRKQVTELKQQRGALLEACEMGSDAWVTAPELLREAADHVRSHDWPGMAEKLEAKAEAEEGAIKLARGGDDG